MFRKPKDLRDGGSSDSGGSGSSSSSSGGGDDGGSSGGGWRRRKERRKGKEATRRQIWFSLPFLLSRISMKRPENSPAVTVGDKGRESTLTSTRRSKSEERREEKEMNSPVTVTWAGQAVPVAAAVSTAATVVAAATTAVAVEADPPTAATI